MSDKPQIEVLSADVDIKTMSTEASVPHFLTFSSSDRISQYPKVYDYQTFRPGWTIAMKRDFAQAIADNWTFELIFRTIILSRQLPVLLEMVITLTKA